MDAWLWDAWDGPVRSALGVTSSEAGARDAAAECITSGQASAARVEKALYVLGTPALSHDFQRTGEGCVSRLSDSGITWVPIARELAAS